MDSDTAIQLEPLTSHDGENGKISFKTAALVTTTVKRRSGSNRTWVKKRSSKLIRLESIISEETFPVHVLIREGKLTELKQVIEDHDLTLKEVDKNGYTLLHHATVSDQNNIMLFLINSGVDLDATDNDGNTALHLAALNDLPEACHTLLSNGAADGVLNNEQFAPLHLASMGKNKALEAILDHPVNLEITGFRGRSPLHVIAENENVEGLIIFDKKVISVLMKEKKSNHKLFSADDNGLTPIHLAARKNCHKILDRVIQYSYQYGLDRKRVLGFLDEENCNPLHAAVDSSHVEIVEVLLKNGASPIESEGDLIPPLHLACSQGRFRIVRAMVEHAGTSIIAHRDRQGKTPLHYCALSVHSSAMIGFLVENGREVIEIDAQDERGRTPLHNAVTSANLCGTKQLITHSANPLVKDNNGYNTLQLALWNKRKVIANLLLELPCSFQLVNNCCRKGSPGIHLAIITGNGEVIPKMLAVIESREVTTHDSSGNNYLHCAASKGDAKSLKHLLDIPEIHMKLNEPNQEGNTALHIAASEGHYRCIDILLNNGAMFHRSLTGETAFMTACKKGFTKCAMLLLKTHPHQIFLCDDEGNTPLHAAAISKSPSMLTLLLNRKAKLEINQDNLSFFDIIINNDDFECAMAVVEHARWQECLDFYTTSRSRSPILDLIEKMPKVAKAVFDRCQKTANIDKTHLDYWESFDFKYLYGKKCDSDKPKVGPGFTKVNPEVEDDSALAQSVTIKYKKKTSSKEDEETKANPKIKNCHGTACNYGSQTMEVLETMKKFNRQELLIHPVVVAYLKSKWRRYGNVYFGLLFLFQLLSTVLLSTFILIVPHPLKQNETTTDEALQVYIDGDVTENDKIPRINTLGQVLRSINLFFNLLFFCNVIFQLIIFYKRKRGAYTQLSIWIQFVAAISSTIFFVFPNPLSLWPLAALCSFLSWLALLLMLEYWAIPGTIVKMFVEVTKTVLLVVVIGTLMLLAFAISFYVLVGTRSEFENSGYAFLTVFGFMLGELPYDMYVTLDANGELPFGGIVLALILLLAILLSIVLANLLIGLAVGDIERVKLNAILQRKQIEIDFFAQVDTALPRKYLQKFSLPNYTSYPNKNRSLLKIWNDSWKWIEAQLEQDQTESSNKGLATCITEIGELKIHMLELKEAVQQMQEANNEFRKRYKGLSAQSSIASFDFEHMEELAETPAPGD